MRASRHRLLVLGVSNMRSGLAQELPTGQATNSGDEPTKRPRAACARRASRGRVLPFESGTDGGRSVPQTCEQEPKRQGPKMSRAGSAASWGCCRRPAPPASVSPSGPQLVRGEAGATGQGTAFSRCPPARGPASSAPRGPGLTCGAASASTPARRAPRRAAQQWRPPGARVAMETRGRTGARRRQVSRGVCDAPARAPAGPPRSAGSAAPARLPRPPLPVGEVVGL